MTPTSIQHVTELLLAWGQAEDSVLEQLTPGEYEELKRLAQLNKVGERAAHTLQKTALVRKTCG